MEERASTVFDGDVELVGAKFFTRLPSFTSSLGGLEIPIAFPVPELKRKIVGDHDHVRVFWPKS